MADADATSTESTSDISMETDRTYEIIGRIVRVLPKEQDSKNTFFIVHTMKLKQDFTILCTYFAPVSEGDSVYAICVYDPTITGNYGYVLRIIRPPFIQPASDKDTIMRIFITVLRRTGFGPAKCHDLYDLLGRQAGSEDRIVSFLSELAALWIEYKDSDMLLAYKEVVKVEQMKKLLLFWHKNRSLRRLYLLGLTNREIDSCKMPLDKIYEACLKNPYTLIGLSLEKCDELLLRQNKQGTPLDRRCGLIVRKIANYLHERAWTGVPLQHLQYHFPDVIEHMEHLKKEYGIVVDFNTAYLSYPYRVETTIANKIQNLLTPLEINTLTENISDDPNVERQIEPIFQLKTLTDEQKAAITGALNNRISIITGGAGSGKSTAISELAFNLEFNEIQYVIGSLTGKAVARIREITKRKSPATLHRLIARAAFVPRFYHLIIDEASMVTCELMYKFFKAFPYDYKITFIGDINQLPPIEFGALMEQLMKCSAIPIYNLNKNMRVEHEGLENINGILTNATKIVNLNSEMTNSPFSFTLCDTFQLFEGSIERVYDIIKAMYDAGVSANDIMIITPYNKELAELNNMFQQIYNEGQRSYVDSSGKLWMLKDRVIMLENCYDIDVMNGQLGVIVDIVEDEGLKIVFNDGIAHLFRFTTKGKQVIDNILEANSGEDVHDPDESLNTSMIALAFGISNHRSQGSEWPYVIFYLPNHSQNKTFVNRNMIYTAITRAKRAVWIVTPSIKEVTDAVLRPAQKRCDNLAQRIMTVPNIEAPVVTKEIPL